MRLSEDKIKQAILHPEEEVRRTAIQYFSKSFSQDRAVMPLVIQAVDRYGRVNIPSLISETSTLPQTNETIQWVLNELSQTNKDKTLFSYQANLIRILHHADPALLQHYKTQINELPALKGKPLERIKEHIDVLSWDSDTCWKALEEFCEKEKGKKLIDQVNLSYASDLVEALARSGDKYVQRILSLLKQEIEEYQNNPLVWMELFLVELAGRMKLQAAIPMIVRKLYLDADYLNDQCIEALTRIGTNSVIEAIYKDFEQAEWGFRLYATNPLERIHSNLAVDRCIKLLNAEPEPDIKTNLAIALLSHFSFDAVDIVRELILSEEWDPQMVDLREELVTACTIMEKHFPEYDEWKAEADTTREKQNQRVAKMMTMPHDDFIKGISPKAEKLDSEPDRRENKSNREKHAKKVGRNDPCPCGSGKKYKKCCMT